MKNKILIIEDEKSLCRALQIKFETEGYEVLTAQNGIEGLEVIEIKRPDLILLDIIMPKMDGMTMLKELRNKEWGKEVPVVVLSNLSYIEKTQDLLKQRISDYLIKTDWKIEDVVKKVKESL